MYLPVPADVLPAVLPGRRVARIRRRHCGRHRDQRRLGLGLRLGRRRQQRLHQPQQQLQSHQHRQHQHGQHQPGSTAATATGSTTRATAAARRTRARTRPTSSAAARGQRAARQHAGAHERAPSSESIARARTVRARAASASRPAGGDKVGSRSIPPSSSRTQRRLRRRVGRSHRAPAAPAAPVRAAAPAWAVARRRRQEIAMTKDMTMSTRTTSRRRDSIRCDRGRARDDLLSGRPRIQTAPAPGAEAGARARRPTFATPEQAVEAAIKAAASGAAGAARAARTRRQGPVNSGDAVQDQKDRDDFVRLAKEKTTHREGPHRSPSRDGVDRQRRLPHRDSARSSKTGKWMWERSRAATKSSFATSAPTSSTRLPCAGATSRRRWPTPPMDPDKTGVASVRAAHHQHARKARRALLAERARRRRRAPSARPSPARSRKATPARREPYHGYYYKVLTAQGPSAPLGAMDFVVQGHMIGGFALVAWPAQVPRHRREDVHRRRQRHRVRKGSRRQTPRRSRRR